MAPADNNSITNLSQPMQFHRCLCCHNRIAANLMHDQHECLQCYGDRVTKLQNGQIEQDLANKKKALGQAVNGMVTALANGKIIPKEPHVVYSAIMDRVGGALVLADHFHREFTELCDLPGDEKPRKVILDYFKAIFLMSVESQKTAPPAPNFNDMTDEELGEETARLMRQKLTEMDIDYTMPKLPSPDQVEAADIKQRFERFDDPIEDDDDEDDNGEDDSP